MASYEAYGRSNSWVSMYVDKGALKVHGSAERAIASTPYHVAHVMAQHIKARGQRGQLAGQWGKPYSGSRGRKGRFMLSADYKANGRGVEVPELNGIVYESSADLHAAVRPNSYSTTGGMWDGLTVVITARGAMVCFRGRSVGQKVRWKQYKSGKRKGKAVSKTAKIANSVKVSNSEKAWVVVASKGVNLLAITREELESIARGIVATYTGPDGFMPNVRWGARPPMGQLALTIARAMR